jgi:preprotein translocase subunit YajC
MISNAYAQAAGAAGPESLFSFLPIVLMFVVLYFLMIRPQQKKNKEIKAMLDALAKGNEVVTVGGVVGKVSKVGDQYVTLEIATSASGALEVTVQKSAITILLPNGTIKSL